MAAGATHSNDKGCELFAGLESAISDATVVLSSVSDGNRTGISADILSKIWRISIE